MGRIAVSHRRGSVARLPADLSAGANAGSIAGAVGDQVGVDHCLLYALEVRKAADALVAGDLGDGLLCDYVFLLLPGRGPYLAPGCSVKLTNRNEISSCQRSCPRLDGDPWAAHGARVSAGMRHVQCRGQKHSNGRSAG